jgi:hypothetical protein
MTPEAPLYLTPLTAAAAALALVFAFVLFRTIRPIPRLFNKRIGRRHAQVGVLYLAWLAVGFIGAISSSFIRASSGVPSLLFDVILGALGIALTLTAAHEFGHKNVRNRASGTLDEDATVTYDEMIEHAFYQGLNLAQALFVAYASQPSTSLFTRAFGACACSAPWLFRSAFPVHSFSKNYSDKSRCVRSILMAFSSCDK